MGDVIAPGIYTLVDCLTPAECRAHIAGSERRGYEAAPITTRKGAVIDARVRINSRVIADDTALAESLWHRLRDHVPSFIEGRQAIGVNERFRYYRYAPSQHFAGHTDAPYRRGNGEESRFTLMVYLNDDFGGGETAFANIAVAPRTGMALMFRHELFHEGKPVTDGTK